MKRSRLLGPAIIAGSVLAGAVLVPSIVNAQTDTPPVEVPAEVDPEVAANLDPGFEDEFTPEDVEAFNAETDELAAKLEAAGIPFTVETEDGVRYVEFTSELTADQEAALEDIFTEMFGDFDVEGDFDFDANYEPTPEELAEWNAETQELIKELKAAGINVEAITSEDGFLDFDFPEDLTEEQWAAVDGLFEELFDCPEDEGDHSEDDDIQNSVEETVF